MNHQLLHLIDKMSGHSHARDGLVVVCARYLSYVLFVRLVTAAVPLLRARQGHRLLCAAAGLLGTSTPGQVASAVVHEPRPLTTHPGLHVLTPHDPGQSFPRDHAPAAIAFVPLASAERRWGVLAAIAAIAAMAISVARVYGGIHHLGDIVGAAALAALAVGAVVLLTGLDHGLVSRPTFAAGGRETQP